MENLKHLSLEHNDEDEKKIMAGDKISIHKKSVFDDFIIENMNADTLGLRPAFPGDFYSKNFVNKEYMDVVFVIDGKPLKSYSHLLIFHSPDFFKKLLFTNFAENKWQNIVLEDVNYVTFNKLLEFIHGQEYIKFTNVSELLKLIECADRYQCYFAKDKLVTYFDVHVVIKVESCVFIFKNCLIDEVKKSCAKLIINNIDVYFSGSSFTGDDIQFILNCGEFGNKEHFKLQIISKWLISQHLNITKNFTIIKGINLVNDNTPGINLVNDNTPEIKTNKDNSEKSPNLNSETYDCLIKNLMKDNEIFKIVEKFKKNIRFDKINNFNHIIRFAQQGLLSEEELGRQLIKNFKNQEFIIDVVDEKEEDE